MSFQIGGVSSTGKILSWGGRSVAINKINAVDVVCDKRAFPKIALLGVFLGLISVFGAFIAWYLWLLALLVV